MHSELLDCSFLLVSEWASERELSRKDIQDLLYENKMKFRLSPLLPQCVESNHLCPKKLICLHSCRREAYGIELGVNDAVITKPHIVLAMEIVLKSCLSELPLPTNDLCPVNHRNSFTDPCLQWSAVCFPLLPV